MYSKPYSLACLNQYDIARDPFMGVQIHWTGLLDSFKINWKVVFQQVSTQIKHYHSHETQQNCFIVKRGGLVSTHMQVLDHIDNASSVWTLIAPENHFSLDWNTGGLQLNDDIIHHHKKIILQDALAFWRKTLVQQSNQICSNEVLKQGATPFVYYTKLGVANLLVASQLAASRSFSQVANQLFQQLAASRSQLA